MDKTEIFAYVLTVAYVVAIAREAVRCFVK